MSEVTDSQPTNRKLTGIQKIRVTVPNPSNAFAGHAIGIGLAEGVECIVIAATRDHCIQFMEKFGVRRSNTQISLPVVMINEKSTVKEGDGHEPI